MREREGVGEKEGEGAGSRNDCTEWDCGCLLYSRFTWGEARTARPSKRSTPGKGAPCARCGEKWSNHVCPVSTPPGQAECFFQMGPGRGLP